jgi:flagellar motor protein MotB
MNVLREGERIQIELGSRVFSSGTMEFSFYGERILAALAATLKSKDFDLSIYHHSGTVDQSPEDALSPWSFSRARSMAVLRQLIDAGVAPQTISLMAYPPNLKKFDDPNSEVPHLTSRLLIIVTMKAK